MPAIVKAQTTKQAKASFKARGRPTLSEKEQRQLDRSIELESRAERARESEKRRAEAAKKRAEKEKKDKVVAHAAQLGTQRRHDRFGFKASQFHLGAFFGKPMRQGERKERALNMVAEDVEAEGVDEDMFGDDDLDDDILLQALDQPDKSEHPRNQPPQYPKTDTGLMPPPAIPLRRTDSVTQPTEMDDMSSLWDDLDSSTQIARELEEKKSSRSGSFSSGDFDLTAEDLDELDPPKLKTYHEDVSARAPTVRAVQKSIQSMLPPPLLNKQAVGKVSMLTGRLASTVHGQQAAAQSKSFMPLSTKTVSHTNHRPPQCNGQANLPDKSDLTARMIQSKPPNAIRGPFLPASSLYCSPDLGFTLSQLEDFVADDVQLTQAVPG